MRWSTAAELIRRASAVGTRGTGAAATLFAVVLALSVPIPGRAAAPSAPEAAVGVLQVRPDFYMLTVDGVNLGLQTGPQGDVVVDAGPAGASAAVLKSIRQLSGAPIRFVIDTNADPDLTGGNASLSAAGLSMMIGWQILTRNHNRPDSITGHPLDTRAPIIARQEVLEQIATAGPADVLSLPSETFTREQYNLRINGDIINVVSEPHAHSAADSVVLFRRADVVVTGAIFDITRFPVLDLAHGGSIDGEIAAIDQVMNQLAVPSGPVVTDSDGTLVIPEHGRLCNQPDLLTYRDMLYAMRQRIQALIDRGESLQQVEAADPARGYEQRFGAVTGPWTTTDFVEAVYRSLRADAAQARAGGRRR